MRPSGEGNQERVAASESASPSFVRILHYVVLALIAAGGVGYWLMKAPTVNPLSDPASAEAMALVQTHQARQAPTLRQAIDQRVKAFKAQGKGIRAGEWRVERETPDTYLVRIVLREEGTRTWFEREYLWRAHVGTRKVEPLSLPAMDLMPLTPDPPADHAPRAG